MKEEFPVLIIILANLFNIRICDLLQCSETISLRFFETTCILCLDSGNIFSDFVFLCCRNQFNNELEGMISWRPCVLISGIFKMLSGAGSGGPFPRQRTCLIVFVFLCCCIAWTNAQTPAGPCDFNRMCTCTYQTPGRKINRPPVLSGGRGRYTDPSSLPGHKPLPLMDLICVGVPFARIPSKCVYMHSILDRYRRKI